MLVVFFELQNLELGILSEAAEQVGQASFQPLCNSLDIDQRDIPHTALDAGIIRPVQPAALRSLFLIDLLLLADATDSAAKPNANIERH